MSRIATWMDNKQRKPDKNSDQLLLILDLDETLIHARRQPLARTADFELAGYHVYQRPFLAPFIEAVAEDFLLAIWSSASDDYVAAIVEKIVPEKIKLEFVWGRSRCTYKRNIALDERRLVSRDIMDHYYFAKPLKKVSRRGFHLDRILIVDDSPEKVQQNYGNAIYPLPYQGASSDDELPHLARYLKTLKDKDRVRNIEKRNWKNQIRR